MRRYLSILLTCIVTSVSAQNVKTYIPEQAYQYFPYIVQEADLYTPTLTPTAYYGALIEHESCVSLKAKRCWSPTSELKTSREQGVGLGQITRAYHPSGKLRFDTLQELKQKHSQELKELSWSTVKQRVDLQIRAIVLLTKANYDQLYSIPDSYQKLAFTDSAYNGGLRDVNKDRRLCGLTQGCNSLIWFNNVEKHCSKSQKKLYGNRSACDINRTHVRDVLITRLPKYEQAFINLTKQ